MGTRLALGLLAAAVVVVVLAGPAGAAVAGGGCHRPAAMRLTDERTDMVLASDCAFMPTVVRVEAGAAVMFTNNDVVPHSFTGVSSSFGDLNEYALDQSVTYTFEEPGVYPYFCALHPSMAGVVVVGDGAPARVQAGAAVMKAGGPAPGAGDAEAPNASDEGEGISATVAAVLAGFAGLLAGGVAGATVTRRRLPG